MRKAIKILGDQTTERSAVYVYEKNSSLRFYLKFNKKTRLYTANGKLL